MKVKVEIECQTGGQLIQHFERLAREATQKIKIMGRSGDISKPLILKDESIIGSYKATISDFTGDEILTEYNMQCYPFHTIP